MDFMRRLALFCFLFILFFNIGKLESSEFPDIQKEVDARVRIIQQMKEEVIAGKIPVYFHVGCEDKVISDKLKSLLSKALREHKDIRIVENRENAWLWIHVLAIKMDSRTVPVSMVCGRDPSAYLFLNSDPAFSFWKNEISEHLVYCYPSDRLGQVVTSIVETFDVGCIEPVRKNREWYLMEMAKK